MPTVMAVAMALGVGLAFASEHGFAFSEIGREAVNALLTLGVGMVLLFYRPVSRANPAFRMPETVFGAMALLGGLAGLAALALGVF